METILLIGNTGKNKTLNGQTIKVRLYKETLEKEKANFLFVELGIFVRHPLSVLIKIAKSIKKCDRIVLITAQRGSKFLIPFINFFNRKHKKPFVLPMIGVNILHKYIDTLNEKEHFCFMHDANFLNIQPKKRDINQLQKITWILPENESIKYIIEKFFGLNNVAVLENFRDFTTLNLKSKYNNNYLNVIFLSRITKQKGIFELIKTVKKINSDYAKIKLDIYGEFYLNHNEEDLFLSQLDENIHYLGSVPNNLVIETISAYDLFVFPTLFKSEGTPGVIAESFIAEVPILSADFIQSDTLMKNNFDSIIYSASDEKNLEKELRNLLDKRKLTILSKNIKLEKEKYSYTYNRSVFLYYICGYPSK